MRRPLRILFITMMFVGVFLLALALRKPPTTKIPTSTRLANDASPLVSGPELGPVKLVSAAEDWVWNPELKQWENPPSHEGGRDNDNTPPQRKTVKGEVFGFPDRRVYVNYPPSNCVDITIIVSNYYPNYPNDYPHSGNNINCGNWLPGQIPDYATKYPNASKSKGWCWSSTASGEPWEENMEYGVAMPSGVQFHSKLYVKEGSRWREWEVQDRGGAIVTEIVPGGKTGYFVDFMTMKPPAGFRSVINACIVYR